jgi:hypothetical protein
MYNLAFLLFRGTSDKMNNFPLLVLENKASLRLHDLNLSRHIKLHIRCPVRHAPVYPNNREPQNFLETSIVNRTDYLSANVYEPSLDNSF